MDLAPNMPATARELFAAEGLDQRVELVGRITALPDRLATSRWDAVSCMWTLHQLPHFDALRAALRQIAVLRRHSGAAVWISDFPAYARPFVCRRRVACVDPSLPAALRRDGIASEAAAFTRASCLRSWPLQDSMMCGAATETVAVSAGLLDPQRAPKAHYLDQRAPLDCARSCAPRGGAIALGVHCQAVLTPAGPRRTLDRFLARHRPGANRPQ